MNEPVNLSEVRDAPNPRVIAELERLLELAKSGELQGFAMLTSTRELGYSERGDWDPADVVYGCQVYIHRMMMQYTTINVTGPNK